VASRSTKKLNLRIRIIMSLACSRLLTKRILSATKIGIERCQFRFSSLSSTSVHWRIPTKRCSIVETAVARRSFSTSLLQLDARKHKEGDGYKVTFVTPEGDEIDCWAHDGETLLDVAHANEVELEGACEGSCGASHTLLVQAFYLEDQIWLTRIACSTCHVILDADVYDSLPEPSDEENDMLDLAFGLTDTSRLGCQVEMTKALDGIRCVLPSATRNMAVDGFKPSMYQLR